jgi:hypothetical protein
MQSAHSAISTPGMPAVTIQELDWTPPECQARAVHTGMPAVTIQELDWTPPGCLAHAVRTLCNMALLVCQQSLVSYWTRLDSIWMPSSCSLRTQPSGTPGMPAVTSQELDWTPPECQARAVRNMALQVCQQSAVAS